MKAKETKKWEAKNVCVKLRVEETILASAIEKVASCSITGNPHVLYSCMCSTFKEVSVHSFIINMFLLRPQATKAGRLHSQSRFPTLTPARLVVFTRNL